MKDAVARAGLAVLRPYIRYAPFALGKQFLLDKVCRPYVAWRRIEAVYRTRAGFRVLCNIQDVIQHKIMFFGAWEPNLTAFVRRRLKPGDGFIDLGANVGYFSLLASQLVGPQGNVLAVEASPSIFQALQANLRRNDAANVRAVNVAVSNAAGTLTIYKAPVGNIGATTVLEGRGYEAECEIPAVPLRDIATPQEIARAKLIKIDIEGAEAPVLQDLVASIGQFRDDVEIVCEVSGDSAAVLLDGFAAAGFYMYEIANEYADRAYLRSGGPTPPTRLHALPPRQVDLVLSRQSADTL